MEFSSRISHVSHAYAGRDVEDQCKAHGYVRRDEFMRPGSCHFRSASNGRGAETMLQECRANGVCMMMNEHEIQNKRPR